MDWALWRPNNGSLRGAGIWAESISEIIPPVALTTICITTAARVLEFMSMFLIQAFVPPTRNSGGELQGILTRWVEMGMTATVMARMWPASSGEASTA